MQVSNATRAAALLIVFTALRGAAACDSDVVDGEAAATTGGSGEGGSGGVPSMGTGATGGHGGVASGPRPDGGQVDCADAGARSFACGPRACASDCEYCEQWIAPGRSWECVALPPSCGGLLDCRTCFPDLASTGGCGCQIIEGQLVVTCATE